MAFLNCVLIIISSLIVQQTYSVDCSQYPDYDSCTDAEYCTFLGGQCVCASTVNIDILFTISTSSYIGGNNFNNLIKPWLTTMVNGGMNINIARVGWSVFSSTSDFVNISDTTWNDMNTFIDRVWYDGGIANLPLSLQDALNTFKSSPYKSQKLNIIIMGSNPYTQGTTNTEVCQYASTLKQLGMIIIYFILAHLINITNKNK